LQGKFQNDNEIVVDADGNSLIFESKHSAV